MIWDGISKWISVNISYVRIKTCKFNSLLLCCFRAQTPVSVTKFCMQYLHEQNSQCIITPRTFWHRTLPMFCQRESVIENENVEKLPFLTNSPLYNMICWNCLAGNLCAKMQRNRDERKRTDRQTQIKCLRKNP